MFCIYYTKSPYISKLDPEDYMESYCVGDIDDASFDTRGILRAFVAEEEGEIHELALPL